MSSDLLFSEASFKNQGVFLTGANESVGIMEINTLTLSQMG